MEHLNVIAKRLKNEGHIHDQYGGLNTEEYA